MLDMTIDGYSIKVGGKRYDVEHRERPIDARPGEEHPVAFLHTAFTKHPVYPTKHGLRVDGGKSVLADAFFQGKLVVREGKLAWESATRR